MTRPGHSTLVANPCVLYAQPKCLGGSVGCVSTNAVTRQNKPFEVISPYTPSGDQPKAIKELAARIRDGEQDVVLMGATGTGKSATTASG